MNLAPLQTELPSSLNLAVRPEFFYLMMGWTFPIPHLPLLDLVQVGKIPFLVHETYHEPSPGQNILGLLLAEASTVTTRPWR